MPKYHVVRVGAEIGERYCELAALNFSPRTGELKRKAWPWCFQPLRDGEERKTFAVALLADEEIVGAILMLGVDMWISGRTEPGWVLLGVNVHPAHRGRGVMLLKSLYTSCFETGIAIGMANNNHDKLHVRYGAFQTPKRITRYKLYRTASSLARLTPALSKAAGIADRALRAAHVIERVGAPRLGPGESISSLTRFDEEYKDFWHRARGSYHMLICRDPEYMKWRYLDAPFETYAIDALRDRDGIQGIVVTRVGLVKGRRVGQIVDLLPVKPHARGFGLLLAAADRRLSQTDAEYSTVSYIPRAELELAARRAGFRSPRSGYVVSGMGFPQTTATEVKNLMDELYFMRGDQDEDY